MLAACLGPAVICIRARAAEEPWPIGKTRVLERRCGSCSLFSIAGSQRNLGSTGIDAQKPLPRTSMIEMKIEFWGLLVALVWSRKPGKPGLVKIFKSPSGGSREMIVGHPTHTGRCEMFPPIGKRTVSRVQDTCKGRPTRTSRIIDFRLTSVGLAGYQNTHDEIETCVTVYIINRSQIVILIVSRNIRSFLNAILGNGQSHAVHLVIQGNGLPFS